MKVNSRKINFLSKNDLPHTRYLIIKFDSFFIHEHKALSGNVFTLLFNFFIFIHLLVFFNKIKMFFISFIFDLIQKSNKKTFSLVTHLQKNL